MLCSMAYACDVDVGVVYEAVCVPALLHCEAMALKSCCTITVSCAAESLMGQGGNGGTSSGSDSYLSVARRGGSASMSHTSSTLSGTPKETSILAQHAWTAAARQVQQACHRPVVVGSHFMRAVPSYVQHDA